MSAPNSGAVATRIAANAAVIASSAAEISMNGMAELTIPNARKRRHRVRQPSSTPIARATRKSAQPATSVRISVSATGPSGGTATRMKTKARPQTAASPTSRARSAGLTGTTLARPALGVRPWGGPAGSR